MAISKVRFQILDGETNLKVSDFYNVDGNAVNNFPYVDTTEVLDRLNNLLQANKQNISVVETSETQRTLAEVFGTDFTNVDISFYTGYFNDQSYDEILIAWIQSITTEQVDVILDMMKTLVPPFPIDDEIPPFSSLTGFIAMVNTLTGQNYPSGHVLMKLIVEAVMAVIKDALKRGFYGIGGVFASQLTDSTIVTKITASTVLYAIETKDSLALLDILGSSKIRTTKTLYPDIIRMIMRDMMLPSKLIPIKRSIYARFMFAGLERLDNDWYSQVSASWSPGFQVLMQSYYGVLGKDDVVPEATYRMLAML